jgi:hypothetical protein
MAKPRKRSGASLVGRVREMIEEFDDHAKGGPQQRRARALKASRTRKRKAAKRSAAARRGAQKRKRNEGRGLLDRILG